MHDSGRKDFLQKIAFSKAGLTLNGLYDTTCMIQLVWLCKIANSYKLDVQILVWYIIIVDELGWVLLIPTCMIR